MHIISEPADKPQLENGTVNYFSFENRLTVFFKNYLRENSALRRYPSFFRQYRLLSFFHHMIPPFNYLKKGDTCVQVGCAEWMLDFGVSMALIMSAIVGPKVRVLVIEPDQRNINALQL